MTAVRIYVQYYCSRCGSRVVPYSKFERDTLAPDKHVLLSSFNSRVDPEERVAYCFAEERFQPARRLTEVEILRLYRQRRGVTIRPPSQRRHRG